MEEKFQKLYNLLLELHSKHIRLSEYFRKKGAPLRQQLIKCVITSNVCAEKGIQYDPSELLSLDESLETVVTARITQMGALREKINPVVTEFLKQYEILEEGVKNKHIDLGVLLEYLKSANKLLNDGTNLQCYSSDTGEAVQRAIKKYL